jgi:hypothetical protein
MEKEVHIFKKSKGTVYIEHDLRSKDVIVQVWKRVNKAWTITNPLINIWGRNMEIHNDPKSAKIKVMVIG